MTSREPFVHAVPNPQTRHEIALAVRGGISPEQLAEEFSISVSTVRSYAIEFENVQRKVQALSEFEREAIIEGCARGARQRWERQHGAEVVRQLLGEA
ncbi:hypothetical protein [Mycobacteroides abscessus]|uniref:hypothetical protein n=1 Tax=Mycobacteroides abscessus TaxID=36809 RepID=UPI0005E98905|nr:hypothetical protein [Mycobacteroides abscessus]CPR69526.1 Uncharacterised protein [Mycobacteroides abscessus]CPU70618.1 Uncharacterised protein [Mycobacteroides abscessus]